MDENKSLILLTKISTLNDTSKILKSRKYITFSDLYNKLYQEAIQVFANVNISDEYRIERLEQIYRMFMIYVITCLETKDMEPLVIDNTKFYLYSKPKVYLSEDGNKIYLHDKIIDVDPLFIISQYSSDHENIVTKDMV